MEYSLKIFLYISILTILVVISCSEKEKIDHYSVLPVLTETKVFENGDQPNRIKNYRDTLYVSFLNKPTIELYDLNFNFISSVSLTHLDSVYPTSFTLTDSSFIVTEYTNNRVIMYSRDGQVLSSFGSMPDNFIKLFPYDIIEHRGVVYITDIMQRSVLAVSIVNTEDITELGELILTIPKDSIHKIPMPSAVTVTRDGRLYVGNSGKGAIDVFTCDGNYIYQLDSISTDKKPSFQAFAFDHIIDLRLLEKDKNSFDPSGIRNQGRLHALDAANGKIHLYNPKGEYITSYPTDSLFVDPNGIAIDIIQRNIFVTDPLASKIFTFSF